MHATNRRLPAELVTVIMVFGLIYVIVKAYLRNVLLICCSVAGKEIS